MLSGAVTAMLTISLGSGGGTGIGTLRVDPCQEMALGIEMLVPQIFECT